MEHTKKKVIYTILEVLFIGIVPLALVFFEYGNIKNTSEAVGFKVGFTGVLLAVIVLFIFKKTVLKRWLASLAFKAQKYESELPIETDSEKLIRLEKELKSVKVLQAVFNAILPLLLLIGLLMLCNALEDAVVRLSGAVGFTVISFCIGTVFSILNAREVRSKNARKD